MHLFVRMLRLSARLVAVLPHIAGSPSCHALSRIGHYRSGHHSYEWIDLRIGSWINGG
jgi:hypothetical protein